MACFSPAKTEQPESKRAETVKAFTAGRTPFQTRVGASHPSPLYLAALRFVHNHLRCRVAHFELHAHFFGFGTPARREAAVSCVIVAPKSFFSWVMVACCSAMLACCSSTLRCSLRRSLNRARSLLQNRPIAHLSRSCCPLH